MKVLWPPEDNLVALVLMTKILLVSYFERRGGRCVADNAEARRRRSSLEVLKKSKYPKDDVAWPREFALLPVRRLVSL